MTFKKKEYDEIFLEGLNNALEEHLISRQEDFEKYIKNKDDIENFYVLLLSVHAEWIAEIYESMQKIYDSTFIDRAKGIDLDKIGAIVGVPRANGTRSYLDILFNLNYPVSEDVIIPAGTLLLSKEGIDYSTSKTVTIPAGEDKVIAPAYSTSVGVNSNLAADRIIKIANNAGFKTSGIKVRNEYSSSGGQRVMGDDEYREYLKNWTDIQEKGTEWAYKEYFRNCDGLDGYKIVPRWDGTGTIKIILDLNGNAGEDLMNTIYHELQENIALYDDDIYICTASKTPINVTCSVNVDYDTVNPYSESYKENLREKIIKLITIYVDGGFWNGEYYKGMNIGEDFIPYKLGVFLDNKISELKNITFNYPDKPIIIGDEMIASAGEINIIME